MVQNKQIKLEMSDWGKLRNHQSVSVIMELRKCQSVSTRGLRKCQSVSVMGSRKCQSVSIILLLLSLALLRRLTDTFSHYVSSNPLERLTDGFSASFGLAFSV